MLSAHCTECDYDLTGLPPDATCPECGVRQDPRFIVLRGYEAGWYARAATATPKRAAIGLAVGFLPVMPWCLITAVRPGGSPVQYAALAIVGASMAIALWVFLRRAQLDGPPCQLWLSADGYWLRDRVLQVALPAAGSASASTADGPSPHTRHGRKRWMTVAAVIIVVSLIASVAWPAPLAGTVFAVFVVWVVVAGRIAKRELKRRQIDVQLPWGGVGSFWRWRVVDYAEIRGEPLGARSPRFRIEFVPKPTGFWTLAPARTSAFLTDLSLADAQALRERIDEWRQAHLSDNSAKPTERT